MMSSAAVCLLLVVSAGAVRAQTPIDRRAPAAPDGVVRIQNMTGSVRVTGWAADTIAVTGTVPAQGGEFAFSVAEGGAKLGIWETGSRPAPSVLDVHVPAGSTVWIKTASADVRVESVTGSIDVYAVSGAIEITGSPRGVLAESLAGDVRIAVESRSVRAKSATGAVSLSGAIADATATTVSGPLTVDGAGLVRGRFESVDGDITFRGAIAARSTLDFVNHAGAVRFELPADAAAEFLINTYEGTLENRIGARAQSSGSPLKGREFRFRTGGAAGGQVTVRTFKGPIIVDAARD